MYLKRRQEIEDEEAQIDQKQQEIEINTELQAARVISKMMDEQENLGVSSETSRKITEEMLTAIHCDVMKPENENTPPVPVSQSTLNPDANVFPVVTNKVLMPTTAGNPLNKTPNMKTDIILDITRAACSSVFISIPHRSDPDPVSMSAILKKVIDNQTEAALPKPELEPFDGTNVLAYLSFMNNFKYVVEDKTQDSVRRLELLKYTKGEAYEVIKECPMIEPPAKGYERAKWLLQRDPYLQQHIESRLKNGTMCLWETNSP